MSTVSPLNMPIEEVVCYLLRESPAVVLSLFPEWRSLPDPRWLDLPSRTHRRREPALVSPSGGTLSIRGHELKPLFDDAVAGVLGEVGSVAARRERRVCG